MPATNKQTLLAFAAASALLAAVPADRASAQGSAGTSRMPQTSQTMPQEGAIGGSPGARGGANAGSETTQTTPGNAGGSAGQGQAPDRRVPPNMQGQGHSQGQANPGNSAGGTPLDENNVPQREQQRQQTQFYPDESFRKNFPAWAEKIKAGSNTADRIVALVESKGQPLTDAQKNALKNVKGPAK